MLRAPVYATATAVHCIVSKFTLPCVLTPMYIERPSMQALRTYLNTSTWLQDDFAKKFSSGGWDPVGLTCPHPIYFLLYLVPDSKDHLVTEMQIKCSVTVSQTARKSKNATVGPRDPPASKLQLSLDRSNIFSNSISMAMPANGSWNVISFKKPLEWFRRFFTLVETSYT